ncbi:MAG: prolyl oligopeptidase family serine peptidase [Planctomycetia bacterium]|jgi:dipeptidyl aminopeptidase/acylaminoacyl peptidase
MKPFRFCLSLVLFLLFISSLHAEKQPLGIEDVAAWNRITETVLSPDGRWVAYKTEPWEGDSSICLCSSEGEKQFEQKCGTGLRITDDSAFLLFTVKPEAKHVKILKLKKVRPGDMPKDALGVYGIRSNKCEFIENIKSYKVPGHWSGWLAYQVQEPAGGKGGSTLYLKNLKSGTLDSWSFVTEYYFAARAKRLFFVTTGDGRELEPGFYCYDLEAKKLSPIVVGANDYRRITISAKGDRVAFLLKPQKQGKPRDFSLYLWEGQGHAKEIVTNHRQEMPVRWRISEHGQVRFSENGKRVFFGIAPPRPERDPITLDEEYPDVDVWHWREGLLHTVQLVNRDRELRRTYLTMYEPESDKFMQIETESMRRAGLLDGGNAGQVLLHSNRPYELQSMWDPMRYDVYLLDLATGKKQTVVKGTRSRVRISPGGKYLMWFSYADASYHTYDVASGKQYRITRPETIRADEEGNTTFDSNAPYGTPGWLAEDAAVLIYDRYDVWKVDPQNRTPPENLTVNGRKEKTVYRLLRLDRGKDYWGAGEPQYLSGVNRRTRASGYYRCSLKEAAVPKKLIGGPYRLSKPIKAADADTVVYTKETFETFPDLIASDLTFRKNVRISDANPQQAEFRWGTAELHRWTSLDGQPLEGILYKPEGFDPSKKYPMIVQFFHKSSDKLFYHRTPEFHRSRIDYHSFVSNGYIVFNPDIYFNKGYIGESAYKSIMPGVTSLVDKGFVDAKRIGIQGHSYSGYQIAYLATRTEMFACIQSGAPVVNFFSAYGGIRWQTGRSRAAQYEHDQTLGTIWEVPRRFYENSPIFAMDKITSPILILHNDHDGAVPWTQGIEFFLALRRLQKPVWMLNYNGEGHCLTKLKNKKDHQIRLSQFFGHYLKGQPMPKWMSKGVPAVDKDHDLGYEVERSE